MTSRSFDGEYIARFIQRFGYGAVRGSSTRGGVGAIIEMARLMRAGCTTAFTSMARRVRLRGQDGRGIAGEKSGHPIMPVSLVLARYWQAPVGLVPVPKPFTRACVYVAPPIYVPQMPMKNMLVANETSCNKLRWTHERGEQWRISQ